jgi:hypothetical protein
VREYLAADRRRKSGRPDTSSNLIATNLDDGKWMTFTVTARGDNLVSLVAHTHNLSEEGAVALISALLEMDQQARGGRTAEGGR